LIKGKTRVFYHGDDFDGYCSGAIVKYFIPDAVMYPISYDDPFPWDDIQIEDTVYMTDFSLQPFDLMLKLKEKCNLIWIDHHQSSINEMIKYTPFKGIQRSSRAASYLTWGWFTDRAIPLPVKLIAEYDIWDHSDPRTLPFQYGLKSLENTNPKDSMKLWNILFKEFKWWELFRKSPVDIIVEKGTSILSYVKESNKQMCKSCIEIDFHGLKCIALNHPAPNSSMIFESVWDNTKYDAMMPFYWSNNKLWCFSLYTDKEGIDVSKVAKKLGGGGHKQAAGFSLNYLPGFLSK
jgi:oligoribonuclease NrnB/cAMP/cGMP phosphodiesterase (DHH superfamily)